mmetsp:Transcript_43304/g.69246  ORF Transcript_43304/g.69246 Transcript_43304/m.69246 type:complete len:215 (-) Transcript_43304:261-905(-)
MLGSTPKTGPASCAPPCGIKWRVAFCVCVLSELQTQFTNAVPTRSASGMKANVPLPSIAKSSSNWLSSLYPKPKVFNWKLKSGWLSLYALSSGRCPFGGVTFGTPSVSNKTTFCRHPTSAFEFRRVSIPVWRPVQISVSSLGLCCCKTAIAPAWPSGVILPSSKITSALSSKTTRDKRSWGFNILITAFTACLTMSKYSKPSCVRFPSGPSYLA